MMGKGSPSSCWTPLGVMPYLNRLASRRIDLPAFQIATSTTGQRAFWMMIPRQEMKWLGRSQCLCQAQIREPVVSQLIGEARKKNSRKGIEAVGRLNKSATRGSMNRKK